MWFAGLFDGEGSITLTNRRRANGGSVKISIANTHLPLLERAVEVAGVGQVHEKRTKAEAHHLDAYWWDCTGAAALEVLRQIRPWLLSRSERADVVLAGGWFPRQARWDHLYAEDASSPAK